MLWGVASALGSALVVELTSSVNLGVLEMLEPFEASQIKSICARHCWLGGF